MGGGWRRWSAGEDGQGLVLSLLLLATLLGIAGLAANVGSAYLADSRLQSSLDSGALGGADVTTQSHGCNLRALASTVTALVARNDPQATGVQVACQSASTKTPGGSVLVTAHAASAGGFAALFGISSFSLLSTSRAASLAGQPFDYAIFQGSSSPPSLSLNGNDTVCAVNRLASGCSQSGSTGNVHSNGDVTVNGNVTVTGVTTASGSVTVRGNPSMGGTQDGVSVISMPLWTAQQLEDLPDTTVQGSPENPQPCTVTGDQSISGNLVCFGSITVSGNVTGSGSLVAFGGNVTLSGNVTADAGSGGVTIAALARDGLGGNITLNGNVSSMDGILYAPQGTITLDGNTTVIGALVAQWDRLNGNNTVYYSLPAVAGIPVQKVELIQ